MLETSRKGINASQFLDFPWLRRQIETHLVFGPVSRYVPLGWLILAISLASLLRGFFAVDKSFATYISSLIDKLIFIIVPIIMSKMTRYNQAALGWIAVKFTLTLCSFLMIIVAFPVSYNRNQTDAIPNLLLGFIWFPWIEFIPKITLHQKHVTLGRVVLSIPAIYFGVKSGYWHW